jgi:hypothetical protein
MYLHGVGHDFIPTPNLYDQPTKLYVRIQQQHEEGVRDPIWKILADPQKLMGPYHRSMTPFITTSNFT